MRKTTIVIIFALYLCLLFFVTLFEPGSRHSSSVQHLNLLPFASIVSYIRKGGGALLVNIIGNILVFMPAGFLLPMLGIRLSTLLRVAFACMLISVLIETLQYFTTTRVTDIDDVILNVTGGVAGYICYALVRALNRPALPETKVRRKVQARK